MTQQAASVRITTDRCWSCGGGLTIEVTSQPDLAEATHVRHCRATHSEPTCRDWRDGLIDEIVWSNDQGRKDRLSVAHA